MMMMRTRRRRFLQYLTSRNGYKIMKRYFLDIYESIISIVGGMGITLLHLFRARNDNVTLQYPEEKWPRPERNIGFDHSNYNVIRSRLHVDMDDCIGCLKCERACPVHNVQI